MSDAGCLSKYSTLMNGEGITNASEHGMRCITQDREHLYEFFGARSRYLGQG